MTFRIEEKIILKNCSIIDLKQWLNKNNYQPLHPNRKIISLYFENKSNNIYLDSEEGSVPRKKIRIRNYNQFKSEDYNLEIKISSIEGRYKVNKKIKHKEFTKYIKIGYFDKFYGVCYPKVYVEYDRQYFYDKKFRVTVDTNIQYKAFNSNDIFKDSTNIVEFKSKNLELKNWIYEKLPFSKERFSKYCRSSKFINFYCKYNLE